MQIKTPVLSWHLTNKNNNNSSYLCQAVLFFPNVLYLFIYFSEHLHQVGTGPPFTDYEAEAGKGK